MKIPSAVCLLAAASFAWGAPPMSAAVPDMVVKGKVLEIKDVESYSYLRLKTKDGETWAAVNKTPLKKGADVTIENAMTMENFESKALKKTFPKIVFGTLAGAGVAAAPAAAPHGAPTALPDNEPISVPKASGPDARTVAEVIGQTAQLKDKPVTVSGKIVKYNAGIMGKNWIHLRDGSGSAKDNTNDLLITTKNAAKLGDVVTVKGVVRADKDFGAGYSYKVMVEDATLQ